MSSTPAEYLPLTVRLLTAPAPGAIAVIELRGTGALQALQAVTRKRSAPQPADFADGRLVLCRVVEGEETLDEALAVAFAGGTAAEIHVHGGMRIVQRLIERLELAGAQRKDAPLSASTDDPLTGWVEAEVDAALMQAQTRRMTRWLLAQRRLLPDLVRAGPIQAADPELSRRARAAASLVGGLTVAIVGPPNAGKSTLANRLIGHDRIITSDLPGTTRDWVSETASIRGWPITLTDTAGIRSTGDPIEREAIHRGVQAAHRADLILIVLDASRTPAELTADRARVLCDLPPNLPHLLLHNKSDLCSIASEDGIPVSALTGSGREVLEVSIAARLNLDALDEDAPAPFTARQWVAIGLPVADPI